MKSALNYIHAVMLNNLFSQTEIRMAMYLCRKPTHLTCRIRVHTCILHVLSLSPIFFLNQLRRTSFTGSYYIRTVCKLKCDIDYPSVSAVYMYMNVHKVYSVYNCFYILYVQLLKSRSNLVLKLCQLKARSEQTFDRAWNRFPTLV